MKHRRAPHQTSRVFRNKRDPKAKAIPPEEETISEEEDGETDDSEQEEDIHSPQNTDMLRKKKILKFKTNR